MAQAQSSQAGHRRYCYEAGVGGRRMRSGLRGGEGFPEGGGALEPGVQDGKRRTWGAMTKAKAEVAQQG